MIRIWPKTSWKHRKLAFCNGSSSVLGLSVTIRDMAQSKYLEKFGQLISQPSKSHQVPSTTSTLLSFSTSLSLILQQSRVGVCLKSQLLMEWNGGIELICITLVITLWPQRPPIPSNYMFVYFMHHFDTETWVQISTKHAISYDGTFFHEYIPQECIPVGCVPSAAVAVWLVDRILDTRLWKHYLSATTVADGKDISKHCISGALHQVIGQYNSFCLCCRSNFIAQAFIRTNLSKFPMLQVNNL